MMNHLQALLPGEDLFGLIGRSFVMGIFKDFRHMRRELGLSHYKHLPGQLVSRDFKTIASLLETDLSALHSEHTCHAMLKSSVEAKSLTADRSVSLLRQGDLIEQPWRWCSECVADDMDTYGISYYRRDHQIPGVKRCSKHGCSLVAACHHCGFEAISLRKLPIPPVDGRCPICGEHFEADMSLLTPRMKHVERICMDMARDHLCIDQKHLAERVQHYMHVTQDDIDHDVVRKAVRRFYRDVTDFYDIDELQEYFVTGTERKSGIYCPALQGGQIYDAHSKGVPLHPVATALVWHFLNETAPLPMAA